MKSIENSLDYTHTIEIMFYDEKARNLIISGKSEHDHIIPEMILSILCTINMTTKPTKLFYADYSKDKIMLNLIEDYKEYFNKTQELKDDYISWDFQDIAEEIKARKEGKSSSNEKI